MAINEVNNKITQYFIPKISVNTINLTRTTQCFVLNTVVNTIKLTNVAQYFIPKVFYNNIYVISTNVGDTLGFYDAKLLKEMDNLTLKQLERR